MNAVLVGVDASPSALSAVRLAAREAAVRKRPLRILYVCPTWSVTDWNIARPNGPAVSGPLALEPPVAPRGQ